jgi:hypothetical protein
MPMRVGTLLLLVAVASLATAAPACVSRPTAAPAVSGCVLEAARPDSLTVASVTAFHVHAAILPSFEASSREAPTDAHVPVPSASRSLDRQPLRTILRI